ncbi:Glycine-rich RNA-binding protein, putative [Perkinsus marinus ATCC 50983]|uniref:Glycine-rich RNA-binding protein, putative n=1 Tax=Perkinsus marinus (strain ATCC 50983 / TXsc) TaxID=423536 RepID=C5KU99_PERM5|nr:Glycine-rich RNA-binding protein, putative [Perkinsus marinus ATCC 50983]EER12141.1 Glycine-rich RNA-binding protein, putative [Perkinsus marinus ATCC 50983]|eukprot:XP_002780346.1 Glycine-rich RNA-binding protein, putative [Perkinsus marinus ATCC 50983]
MTDKMTGRCRGFGFVTYATTGEVENCLANGPHQLNGKHVDVNRSQDPKDAHKGGWGSDRSGGPSRRGGGGDDPKKVFCGGLPQDCDTERLRQHFSQYGNIVDCIAMRDRDTGRSKGYGFVTFDSEDAVNAAINGDNTIDGRWVEVRNSQRFGGSDGSSQGKGRGWGSFESQGYGDAYSQAAAAAMQQGWAGMAAQQAAYYPYAAYYGSYQAGQQGGQAAQMDPYAAYYAAMAAAANQQQQQPVAAASQETPQQQPQQSYPSGGGASMSADAGRSNPY